MGVYYESRQSEIYGGTISLIVLATCAVVLRLIARQKTAAKLWWDDFSIVAALIFAWGLSACYWMQIRYCGLGRHTNAAGGPVGPVQLLKFYKLFLAIQLMYFASAVSIKTSLILLYYRIFGVVRWFRWLLAAVWAVVLLYFIVCLFVAVFECSPVAYYWDKSIESGTCINQNQFYRWNGVANLLIDFAIWSLTLPVVWRLHLSTRQRLSLSFVFLLGLLACTASIVRVIAFDQVKLEDITYTLVTASIWTTIEQSIGIVCACLPTTRPLIKRFLKGVKDSSDRDTDRTLKTSPIPLSYYAASQGVHDSTDTSNDGFVRLTDVGAVGNGSVTAHASTAGSDKPPVAAHTILKQQRLEQHVEHATYV
ncbi:MAG: hypothetical protein LQ343_006178 [Gyalolechia ehrenbergii]|nr:MAG: hypothetical protein LQ343_006178 [Gyalolechia ehrenbergii]